MPILPPKVAYQKAFQSKESGLSYRAIAQIVGVSGTTISRWFKDKCSPYGRHANHTSFQKGQIPPYKGKPLPEEIKAKLRGPRPNFHGNAGSFKSGEHASPKTEFKKGQVPWITGKHHAEKARVKISQKRLGCIPWNKDKHILLGPPRHSQETKLKMSEARKKNWAEGKYDSPEYRLKLSEFQKKQHADPEYRRKIMSSRRPTDVEQKLIDIIAKHNLPYKYTGDGSFLIGNLNPDFINTNSEKVAIDIFGDYWHMPEEVEERRSIFTEYGWDLIILWGHDLKKENEGEIIGLIGGK